MAADTADEDDDAPDEVRSARDVARRTLALFFSYALSVGGERADLEGLLTEGDLWTALSPWEMGLFKARAISPRDLTQLTWRSECLVVLLWALCKLDVLPPPDEQCDTSVLYDLLPPFADIGLAEFVESAVLRPDDELIMMADRILDLHWAARDGKLHSRPPREPVDIEVIQERHHAINWVIGYDGQAWDDVATDT